MNAPFFEYLKLVRLDFIRSIRAKTINPKRRTSQDDLLKAYDNATVQLQRACLLLYVAKPYIDNLQDVFQMGETSSSDKDLEQLQKKINEFLTDKQQQHEEAGN